MTNVEQARLEIAKLISERGIAVETIQALAASCRYRLSQFVYHMADTCPVLVYESYRDSSKITPLVMDIFVENKITYRQACKLCNYIEHLADDVILTNSLAGGDKEGTMKSGKDIE